MLRTIKILLAAFIFSLLFAGCSDNSNKPSSDMRIWPLDQDNYWLYNTTEISEDGPGETWVDSAVVTSMKEVDGQVCSVVSMFSGQSSEASEMFTYIEGDSIFVHTSSMMNWFVQMPFEVPIEEKWVLFVNPQAYGWEVFESDMLEFEFPFGQIPLTIKMKLSVFATSLGNRVIEVPAGKFTTFDFEYDITISGSISGNMIPVPFPIDMEQKLFMSFAKGVGLVKYELQPGELPIMDGFEMPGSRSSLIKYRIYN